MIQLVARGEISPVPHEHAAAEAEDVAAALVAPVDAADRPFEVDVELRREVMLEQGADRPRGRRRPLVGQRVEVGVGQLHRLAVAVDLAVLTPHAVRQTRVPHRVLGVGAGDQEGVARAERGRLNDTPASTPQPVLFSEALQSTGQPRRKADADRVIVVVVLDVDLMQNAGHLSLAPALLDVQRADDVGPALAAEGDRPGRGPAISACRCRMRRSCPGSAPRWWPRSRRRTRRCRPTGSGSLKPFWSGEKKFAQLSPPPVNEIERGALPAVMPAQVR